MVFCLLVPQGKLLGIGAGGNVATSRFATTARHWELVESPADEVPIREPTGGMVGYSSENDRISSTARSSEAETAEKDSKGRTGSPSLM